MALPDPPLKRDTGADLGQKLEADVWADLQAARQGACQRKGLGGTDVPRNRLGRPAGQRSARPSHPLLYCIKSAHEIWYNSLVYRFVTIWMLLWPVDAHPIFVILISVKHRHGPVHALNQPPHPGTHLYVPNFRVADTVAA